MYGSTCGGKTKNAADSQRFNFLERDTEYQGWLFLQTNNLTCGSDRTFKVG